MLPRAFDGACGWRGVYGQLQVAPFYDLSTPALLDYGAICDPFSAYPQEFFDYPITINMLMFGLGFTPDCAVANCAACDDTQNDLCLGCESGFYLTPVSQP